ncbi:MAG: hypothetical protein ACD_58C00097G0003 [uncultured bacterium]|nr:MAG: hypothetical protein ACD_58C00097G0003 [uncultured bacterium]
MKNPFQLKQLNKSTIYLLILGVGIGLFFTAQWKTEPSRASSDPINSYVSLKDTKKTLTTEQIQLKTEISQYQLEINDKQSILKKNTSSKKTIDELDGYKKRLGITEIKGEGVIITIDDANKNLANIDSIAHAADLRDLINFLWATGADAISINGERIVLTTSIDCIVNTILINTTRTTAPFIVSSIGDSKILERQLNNQNNLKDIKKRVKNEGLIFNIESLENLTIPAYKGSFVLEYTKIAEE